MTASRDYGGFPDFGASFPSLLSVDGHILKEFPINVLKVFNREIVFSGGGYFRLFPYYLVSKWMKKSIYVMTYFDPRDFDSDQPMLPLVSFMRKIKSYVGLKSAFNKFELLLDDFDFINLSEANDLIDWSRTRTINIK
jgi:hypothetical protein